MNTGNCFDLSTYKSMLAGQLTAVETEKVCKHLEGCDRCCQVVRSLPENALVASMRGKGAWPTNAVESGFVRDLAQKILKQSESRGVELSSFVMFSCPGCENKLKVKKELVGQKVKCPRCSQVILIPAEPAAKVPASASTTREDAAAARTLPPRDLRSSDAMDAPTVPPVNPRTKAPVQKDDTNPASKPDTAHDIDSLPDRGLTDFLAPPQQPDEIGRLGMYRVLKVLGAGGMGVVYKAEDPGLKRMVAIKAMLPAVAASASAKVRFQREAQAAAAIKHNHIVTIFQVTEDRGVPFLAMEFLEGEPLDSRLKREGRLPMAEAMRIGREMAEGMAAAHERGLIHRDIKPANTWLEASPGRKSGEFTVKILDFGLARATDDQANLTQSGAIIGTPAYMAPEQGRGEKLDARCDLWSLGVVLYCMCTGELPFKGTDTISTLMAVATTNPPPPAQINPAVPAGVSDLVMKLLEKDPARRPASAGEVVHSLEILTAKESDVNAVLETRIAKIAGHSKPRAEPRSTRPPSRKVAAVALAFAAVAALVAGVVFFWQTPHGVIRVEINDPGIEAAFLQDGMTFKGKDGQVIKVTPSKEVGLHIKRGDLEFDTDKFILKNRETITLKIEWFKEGKVQVVRDGQIIGSKGSKTPAVAGSKDSTTPTVREQPVDLLKLIDPRTVSIVQKYEVFENSQGYKPQTPTGVAAVALSRDGKRVLTVTAPPNGKGTPILWNAGSGKKIQTFPAIAAFVTPVVALSGDGKRVFTMSDDYKTAILWEADSGRKIQTFQTLEELKTGVTSVALSDDGKLVATGSFEGKTSVGGKDAMIGANAAFLWDTATGKKIQKFEGHTAGISSIALSRDGKYILTSDGSTAILWEAATAKKIQTFQERGVGVHGVALSDDGKLVLTRLTTESSAILWEAASGKKIRTFKGDMYTAALSGDGKLLLGSGVYSNSDTVLWETATGKKIHTFQGSSLAVALSEDGRRVLIGTTTSSPDGRSVLIGTTTLWEIKGSLEPRNNSIVQKFHVHAANVQSVALSGRHILTGSADKTAILWDAVTGKNLHCFQGHAGIVWSVALSADAKRALTGSEDKTAILWDAVSNKKLQTFEGHSDQVMSVALSGDRQNVLTGSLDKTAILWEAGSGKKIQTLRGHAGQIQSVALCGSGGDNKLVLTGSDDRTAILWDAASGKKLQAFVGHVGGVTSVAVSGDGKRVLTGSADKTAILWEAASGKKLQIFKAHQVKPGVGPMIGHTGAVNCVALSDDARFVLTGSDDKTAILWEAASGKILQTFEGHAGEVYAVTMRGDGKLVVTGSKDQTAILWEVKALAGQ